MKTIEIIKGKMKNYLKEIKEKNQVVVAYAFNLSTQEAEIGG